MIYTSISPTTKENSKAIKNVNTAYVFPLATSSGIQFCNLISNQNKKRNSLDGLTLCLPLPSPLTCYLLAAMILYYTDTIRTAWSVESEGLSEPAPVNSAGWQCSTSCDQHQGRVSHAKCSPAACDPNQRQRDAQVFY